MKITRIDHGKASTLAPVGAPEHRARGVTRATTLTRGCRKVLRLNSIRKDGAISNRGWARKFDDPIPVAKGKELVTLRDAARQREHDQPPHDDEGGYSPGDYFQFFFRRVVAYFRRLNWRRNVGFAAGGVGNRCNSAIVALCAYYCCVRGTLWICLER